MWLQFGVRNSHSFLFSHSFSVYNQLIFMMVAAHVSEVSAYLFFFFLLVTAGLDRGECVVCQISPHCKCPSSSEEVVPPDCGLCFMRFDEILVVVLYRDVGWLDLACI